MSQRKESKFYQHAITDLLDNGFRVETSLEELTSNSIREYKTYTVFVYDDTLKGEAVYNPIEIEYADDPEKLFQVRAELLDRYKEKVRT